MTVAEYNHSVTTYADGLYRFVLKNLRVAAEAQDIVQDSFEKLWIKHENVSFSKVRSYLFTTAYHTLIDFTRRKKNLLEIEQIANMETTVERGNFDIRANLDKALGLIPEIQRTVILLRDYEGYNYEEIGEITGLSESQVKVYIYRGRLALRKLIGNPEILV